MRSPLALVAAAGLLLGACSYDFTNPAEKLDSGEIAGRVLSDDGTGTLTGAAGVGVTLRNSQNSVTTRSTGRFFLYGMMPGRHTVIFGDGSTLALRRDIDMVWGSDGQPEGVILGDLVLRQAVTLKGSVKAPAVPAGYATFTASSAVVVDEETGQQLRLDGVDLPPPAMDGSFDYSFPGAPSGRHRIRVAVSGTACDWYATCGIGVTFVAGPLILDIPDSGEGLQHQLNDLTPVQDTVPGKLRFRIAVAGASWSGGYDVTLTPPPLATPAPDSTGTYELDLDPGLYSLTLAMPAVYSGTLLAPDAVQAVVVGGQTTELGTFYFVDSGAVSKGDNGCLTTADCYSMETCSGGQCVFHEPAQPAACLAGTSIDAECSAAVFNGCTQPTGGTTVPCNGGLGVCGQTPGGLSVCVPNGQPDCRFDIYVVPRPVCF